MENETKNYEEFKAKALATEPSVIKLSLNEVDLIDEATIRVGGQAVTISEQFMGQMIDFLGIPRKFINDYSRYMGSDIESFINFLKNTKGAKENMDLYLLGNRSGNSVVGLQKEYMPREIFFKTFEDIMNKKQFEIKNMLQSGTSLHIQTINKGAEFNVNNLDLETFYPGFSLDSNNNGMSLGSFIYRLVCTNGMVGKSSEEVLKYQDPGKFYEGLGYLMKHDFVPKNFSQNVYRAMETNASLLELENARKLIKHSGNDIDNLVAERFIPTRDAYALLQRNNIDPIKLDDAKKKNIVTDVKVWDMINGITDFASHDYHINVNESARLNLQVQAGSLLNKKCYDTQNLIRLV